MKTCIIEGCSNECQKNVRYCREHYLERKRKLAKERYLKFGRHTYLCTCIMCGKQFRGSSTKTFLCSPECKNKYQGLDSTNATDNYLFKKKTSINEHRYIIEELLQRKLKYDEVIHHIDGNPKNNSLENLLILSRSNHGKLHTALIKQKAILIYKIGELVENNWILFKKKFTEDWLKENKIDCLIASNIGKTEKVEEILNFL